MHRGEGSEEYRNPRDFSRRTFITHGLEQLLAGAIKRLTGPEGHRVADLQTNSAARRVARTILIGSAPNQDAANKRLEDSPAIKAAESLNNRGSSTRRKRNTLVFLAADRARLEDLKKAVRDYLAWQSIERDSVAYGNSPETAR